jgi:hypothetical protein
VTILYDTLPLELLLVYDQCDNTKHIVAITWL